jgi:hypothetical protein
MELKHGNRPMSFASDTLAVLERHTPLRPELPSREEIRRAIKDHPLNFDPAAIRRAAWRPWFIRKGRSMQTPPHVKKALYDAYVKNGSVVATAKMFGLSSGANIYRSFKRWGFAVKSMNLQPRITHNGITYAFDGKKHYRQCGRGKQGIFLHRVIWEEGHGPIPIGHRLIIIGPDWTDFSERNIKCLSASEFTKENWRRRKNK